MREGEERFLVSISSPDDAVIVGSSTATVTIQDNDGIVAYEMAFSLMTTFVFYRGTSPVSKCHLPC